MGYILIISLDTGGSFLFGLSQLIVFLLSGAFLAGLSPLRL